MSLDSEFYPAGDEVDWQPLHVFLCGSWMFMQADTDGRRYYKHKLTREYLVLASDMSPGDVCAALEIARRGLDAEWALS